MGKILLRLYGCCQSPNLVPLAIEEEKKLKLASHVKVYLANHICIHTVPIQLHLLSLYVLHNVSFSKHYY